MCALLLLIYKYVNEEQIRPNTSIIFSVCCLMFRKPGLNVPSTNFSAVTCLQDSVIFLLLFLVTLSLTVVLKIQQEDKDA